MVSTNAIILGALSIGAFFLLATKTSVLGATKQNDVPTFEQFIDQQETDLGTSQTQIGAVNLPEGKATQPNEVLSNILTGNLINEDSLRSLINSELNKQESVTQGSAGAEVATTRTTIRDLDISTPKSLEVFRDDTSSLIVHDAFKPIGDAEILGVRNKFISENAKARTQPTFSATITTKTGGTRNILGSEALIKRLQQNLASN
jgi:hypothetical protein